MKNSEKCDHNATEMRPSFISGEPLMLEQLRQMDGKPVWVQNLEEPEKSQWRLCHWDRGKYLVLQGVSVQGYLEEDYGETWTAYAYQAAQSIMELLDRAEAAEARCKRLDEARERANEAANKWEGRCKILETRLETAEKMVKEYQDTIVPGYRERAEKAERERDAAVSDIETILAYRNVNLDTCQYCKNGQCYARGGTKPCFPKWRREMEE